MKKIVPADAVLIPDKAIRVFKGEIFDVYQWPQPMFDGSEHTFEMLKRPDTVAVIAIADGKILVLDEEQPHVGRRQSLPTGRADKPSEDVITAAKREVLEETGFSFRNWKLINVIQPHSKIEWFVYYFVANDGEQVSQPKLDAGEKIRLEKLPFSAVKKLVLNKAGYLGEALDIFEKVTNLDELLNLPEFVGKEVDR